ncbi:MAG: hypothetical protein EBT60_10520 [Bacteroidetes bacterium]|nr:hypothetical protein [Bacteroidota bacterium]
MAIFVDNLAFTDSALIDLGKVSILIASSVCAMLGFFLLRGKD